ncbi:MAG TPA: hypothetical protein VGH89_04970 [Pseudonocardia sp.]|jgi:hypothetical protein
MNQHGYGIVDEDDLLHTPPPGVVNWSENLQLVVNDGRTGVYVHLGRQTDDPGIWEGIIVVFLDGERLLVSRTFGRAPDQSAATSGPLSFRPVVPCRQWQLSFDGMVRPISRAEGASGPVAEGVVVPMTLDLAVHEHSPIWGVGSQGSAGASSSLHDQDWARTHVEQACRVSGRLRVPGLGIDQTVDNVGFRDHSVGPRDFTHLVEEFWSCCAFPSGRAFVGLHVVQDNRAEPFDHGFVFDGDKLHDITALSGPPLTSALGEPTDFQVTLASAAGEAELTAHMTNSMAFSFDYPFRMPMGPRASGAVPVEGPAEYTWDGEDGFGWIERIYIRKEDYE